MSERTPIADALAELARGEATPAISAALSAAMIERALHEAEENGPAKARRSWKAYAAVAAVAVAALGFAGTQLASEEAGSSGELAATRVTMASGDELAMSPGARFEVRRSGAHRRIDVDHGALSFDVRPLEAGHSFEVVTRELTARVVGTVFTVEAWSSGSAVRVYEGRVEVEHDGEVSTLRAGETLEVGERRDGADPLFELARAAAARRTPESDEDMANLVTESPDEPAPSTAGDPNPVGPSESEHGGVRSGGVRLGDRTLDSPTVTPALAQGWLLAGDAPRALEAAQAALRNAPSASWRMVEGDALRSERRLREAVTAYALATHEPRYRFRAGYLVAVTLERLGDSAGALNALREHACTDPASPLAERSLLLEHRLLERAGRDADARRVAHTYLSRFPAGPAAENLRRTHVSDDSTEESP